MKNILTKICISALLIYPTSMWACSDLEYEKHLTELEALAPHVSRSDPSQRMMIKFFRALPKSFACFDRLFGYHDKPAPMYSKPEMHGFFNKIKGIVPKDEYIDKLISLSVNAKWEADQIGSLQYSARTALDENTVLFIGTMELLDEESQKSIWGFLFDGPHPSNWPLSPQVKSVICKNSNFNCLLSKEIYRIKVAKEHAH